MAPNKLSKNSKARLYGILTPACSGKSTLFNRIKEHKLKFRKGKQLILIDIDEIRYEMEKSQGTPTASSTQEHSFPLLKETVEDTLAKYPKYRILIITSNPELLKFLSISDNKTKVYVQSSQLFLEGIAPLLSPLDTTKEDDDDAASDSESDNKDDPPSKPLPTPGQFGKGSTSSLHRLSRVDSKSGSIRSNPDLSVAKSLPAELATRLSELTGKYITVTDNGTTESTPITFATEVGNICKSRDRIMQEFAGSYEMYYEFDDLFDFVVRDFKIEFKG